MSLTPLIGKGRLVAREQRAATLHTVSWCDHRITFDHRRWVCADAELVWQASQHLVVLTEEGGTSCTQVRIDGRSRYDGCDRPGALSFVPASAERLSTYRHADLVYSALWIDPAVQEHLAGCGGLAAFTPIVNGSDAVIGSLLAALRAEVAAGRQPGASYVEHLAALILLRVSALDGRPLHEAPHARRLSPTVLAKVQDYVEANLGADLGLSALATLVNMPIERFARQFKATTGLAPYAYVIARRVRRAEALLKSTDQEIGAIALTLGFSSQSHFTTTFRQATGATPGAYRAQFFS